MIRGSTVIIFDIAKKTWIFLFLLCVACNSTSLQTEKTPSPIVKRNTFIPSQMPTSAPTIEPLLSVTPISTMPSARSTEYQVCEPVDEGLASPIDFHTVVMWDEQAGWIFGDKGVVFRYNIAPGESTLGWQQNFNLPEPYPMLAFSPVSASEGWGISGYIVRYQNGQWKSTQEINGVELRDIVMLNSLEGWLVGNDVSEPTAFGDGLIFHYDQAKWVKAFTFPYDALLAIDMLNAEGGWAVGGIDGVIVRYHNKKWEKVDPVFKGSHTFIDVDVVGEEEAWFVGSWIILHYQNGNWEETAPNLTERLLFDPAIDMVNADEGWIVGRNGYILHYQNGQWKVADSPTDNDLLSISMVNTEEGWIVGAKCTILHYYDGKWKLVSEARSAIK